jgi:hypothetical protein
MILVIFTVFNNRTVAHYITFEIDIGLWNKHMGNAPSIVFCRGWMVGVSVQTVAPAQAVYLIETATTTPSSPRRACTLLQARKLPYSLPDTLLGHVISCVVSTLRGAGLCRCLCPSGLPNFAHRDKGPTQPHIQWVPGLKLPRRGADLWPPSSVEDKNNGAIPPYIFMAWCLIN